MLDFCVRADNGFQTRQAQSPNQSSSRPILERQALDLFDTRRAADHMTRKQNSSRAIQTSSHKGGIASSSRTLLPMITLASFLAFWSAHVLSTGSRASLYFQRKLWRKASRLAVRYNHGSGRARELSGINRACLGDSPHHLDAQKQHPPRTCRRCECIAWTLDTANPNLASCQTWKPCITASHNR